MKINVEMSEEEYKKYQEYTEHHNSIIEEKLKVYSDIMKILKDNIDFNFSTRNPYRDDVRCATEYIANLIKEYFNKKPKEE